MNVGPATALVPANDYYDAIAEDNTRFNPDPARHL
jgi:hypothetical protein